MAPTRLTQLLKSGRFYKRSKGQVISTFDNKDTIYMLESGYIKRYMITNDGSLGVQSVYGPGSFFPLTPVFAGLLDQNIYMGDVVYCYEAMSDVAIFSLKISNLAKAAKEDPLLYKDILYEAGRRLQSNIQRLENRSFKSSVERVAHYIVFLTHRFGEPHKQGTLITVSLTQQDMADNLNMTRETISRAMSKLHSQGLVLIGRKLIVPDVDKLKELYI